MYEVITKPWPWYVAGPLITLVMVTLILLGKNFGISSNLRTMCSMCGAGRRSDFFNFNWKEQIWNLIFVLGTIIGGFIAAHFMSDQAPMQISSQTIELLKAQGFQDVGKEYLPQEIFGLEALTTVKGLSILIIGGLLVGFGTRYAGGCTSGHAISGLSNLQLPSLIAVIGFFIGGLLMTYFILPYLF